MGVCLFRLEGHDVTRKDFVYADPPYAGRFTDYFNSWSDNDSIGLERRLKSLPCQFLYSMWSENKYRRNDSFHEAFSMYRIETLDHWGNREFAEYNDRSSCSRMKSFILGKLSVVKNGYTVCGVVDKRGRVYPLGSDTKVISSIFEIVTRQAVALYANHMELVCIAPEKQNHYPDFTLMRDEKDQNKIAIDVKTTYKRPGSNTFSYTLGSYTSYIHPETESKNIVYPYSEYSEHWIIGFVYRRAVGKRALDLQIYSLDSLSRIELPFTEVEVFMQEKWKIAGDKAGSGNTANIGSISGTIGDFIYGKSVFESESEFIDYWRGYKRTMGERTLIYSNVNEYRHGKL